jgi:hypothetical protein
MAVKKVNGTGGVQDDSWNSNYFVMCLKSWYGYFFPVEVKKERLRDLDKDRAKIAAKKVCFRSESCIRNLIKRVIRRTPQEAAEICPEFRSVRHNPFHVVTFNNEEVATDVRSLLTAIVKSEPFMAFTGPIRKIEKLKPEWSDLGNPIPNENQTCCPSPFGRYFFLPQNDDHIPLVRNY